MSITTTRCDVEESILSVDIIDIYLRASDDLSEINMTYQLPERSTVRSKKNSPPAAAAATATALEYHQLNRPYDELVVRTMNRLVINCKSKLSTASSKSKKVSKASASHSKSAPRSGTPSSSSSLPISCRIKHNIIDVSDVDVHLLRVSDLQSDMLIYVDSFCFKVVRNHPTIVMLSTFPKKVLFCGCLVVPQVCLESADDFQCTWLCEDSPRSNTYVTVCTEKSFTPMLQHAGCRVKLLCSAVDSSCSGSPRMGRPVVSYLSGCVQHADVFNRMLDIRRDYHLLPRHDAMMGRGSSSSSSMTSRSSKEIRVVTYNILAEPYATSNQAINSLFRYCDKSYLDSEYRLQRSLEEILACDADVVCLQECDLKAYEAYLLPALGSRGYVGHYSDKSGREGCATFVLSRSYIVLRTFDVSLKNILRTAPYLSFLYDDIRPDLRDVIGGKLGTVCQLTVMRSVSMPHREIVVCNTHLFYHPFAGMIRLFQLFAITRLVEGLLRDLSSSGAAGYEKLTVPGADEVNVQYALKEERLRQSLLSRGTTIDAAADVDVDDDTADTDAVDEDAAATTDDNDTADAVDVDEPPSAAHAEEVPVPVQRGVFIAGDLNSMPSTAAIEFLTTGSVSPALWIDEWNNLQDFRWGNGSSSVGSGEEELEGVQEAVASMQLASNTGSSSTVRSRTEEHSSSSSSSSVDKSAEIGGSSHDWSSDVASMRSMVTHQLGLINASGLPQYTNYTADFKDTLDYVMVSQHCFQVVRIAPFPPESVLSEHVALPSEVFPSDHIAVAVDIKWMDGDEMR